MARHEIHLVEIPTASRAALVALTRRLPLLDEQAVLRAVASNDALPLVVAAVESAADAENLRTDLEKIGCGAVIIEQAGVAADLRDRLREVFVGRRSSTGAPVVAPSTPASVVPVSAEGRRLYQRLYGSSPAELEKVDARRRLHIQLAVGFGIVATMALMIGVFVGLSTLADRAVNANLGGEDEIDSAGNVVPPDSPRAAVQPETPEPSDEANASAPGAPPDQAGPDRRQGSAGAGSSVPNAEPASDRAARDANASAATPSRGSPEPPRSEDAPSNAVRIVMLALAAFIGFGVTSLVLALLRWLARRFAPRAAAAIGAGALVLVLSGAAFVALDSREAASSAAPPLSGPAVATTSSSSVPGTPGTSSDSVDDGAMPAAGGAGGPAAEASGEPAVEEGSAEGSGGLQPASMAGFVRSLPAGGQPSAEPKPFTAMAQRLASRRQAPAAEGSDVPAAAAPAEGSGGLVAVEDFDTAEQNEAPASARMSDFVASLDAPTRCPNDSAAPFGAMLCRLDEERRAERRRARERELAAQPAEPADSSGSAAPEGSAEPVADAGEPSVADRGNDPGLAAEPSASGSSGSPGPTGAAGEPPAAPSNGGPAQTSPDADSASASDSRQPSTPASDSTSGQEPDGSGNDEPANAQRAARLSGERREESLAFALGMLLSVLVDVARLLLTRRSGRGT